MIATHRYTLDAYWVCSNTGSKYTANIRPICGKMRGTVNLTVFASMSRC